MKALIALLALTVPVAAEINSYQFQQQLEAHGLERLGHGNLEAELLRRKLQERAKEDFLRAWLLSRDKATHCLIIERDSGGKTRCD